MKRSAKVIPFRKPAREKTLQERIEETLDLFIHQELAPFSCSLATARALWKQYPELVTAPAFPDELRKMYLREYPDDDPDEPAVDYGGMVISPERMTELRAQAELWAQVKPRPRHPGVA